MGFRDDTQAARAIGALLAPLPYSDLWSAVGPSARARLLLDRDLQSEGLTVSEQFRLFAAAAVWPSRGSERPLPWQELTSSFQRWAQRYDKTSKPLDLGDPRTVGDVRELVRAIDRGPDAVDGWLACYAGKQAQIDAAPDQLLSALASIQQAQATGCYPSFADVARWTGLDLRKARALLERLEALGWITPPELGRGRHAKKAREYVVPRAGKR